MKVSTLFPPRKVLGTGCKEQVAEGNGGSPFPHAFLFLAPALKHRAED